MGVGESHDFRRKIQWGEQGIVGRASLREFCVLIKYLIVYIFPIPEFSLFEYIHPQCLCGCPCKSIREMGCKMNLRILNLAIVALLALPGSVLAVEDWEKKLMDEGWIKLTTDDLMAFTNITHYLVSENDKKIAYIDLTGKKGISKSIIENYTTRLLREIRDDMECFKLPDFGSYWICYSVWKRGSAYKSVHENGLNQYELSIKNGNVENFK